MQENDILEQQLVYRSAWDEVLHSHLLFLDWPLPTQHLMQHWPQMAPELHTNKCIKDRVQAAVGESNEPTHVERIIKLDACFTFIKWSNRLVSQSPQEDDHVVWHPADEEHSHDAEDQLNCFVLCVGSCFRDFSQNLHVAETHHHKSYQEENILLVDSNALQGVFIFTAQGGCILVGDRHNGAVEQGRHGCSNADHPH